MDEGYWRGACSSLSLHDAHGSASQLCARHAPQAHAPHAAHAHARPRVQHVHHHACPVHSPFRQPTPEYCAAHAQQCCANNS
ncbi:hypothetical protein JYU34_004044 [Plutella xylostella]|uniref:Uncharacterized protein n=1 Tax=Plutella xylostella TaxID=51655 RepID=A0ABQ7QX28_PLUXY|nr:hypothetical protein JYU34_004044 [Plutella xylostella]